MKVTCKLQTYFPVGPAKVLAQAPTAQFKELLAKKARTGDSRRCLVFNMYLT